jgi:hypothetical protein
MKRTGRWASPEALVYPNHQRVALATNGDGTRFSILASPIRVHPGSGISISPSASDDWSSLARLRGVASSGIYSREVYHEQQECGSESRHHQRAKTCRWLIHYYP